MSKTVILGIDGWYPQVDGVTNVVKSYREHLEGEYDCEIVAPSYGKREDAEGEKQYCGNVFHNRSLAVPFIKFRNSVPGHDGRLKKFLNEKKPALLHAHSPFAICALFARYGRKHGIPVVFTFHTKFKDEFMRVTRSRLATAIMMSVIMRNIRRVDYVWAVSQSSANTLRGYGFKGDIKVMRNGTDFPAVRRGEREALAARVRAKYGISPGERVFMYAGRVVSVKNLGFSFGVTAELKRRGFACRFFVVGGGDELEEHKRLAAKLGVGGEVVFTGFVGDREELRAYYACADLFLLPSVFDNAPLVIHEAAAMGTPALVPAGSSAAEIITDGVDGCSEKLDAALWADRIERLFSDGSYEAVRKGCASLAYTWDDALREVRAEYARIISEGGKKRKSKK